ncbi:hypothetical protein [Bacteriophage sp.]|nr:hypothetical protein [Bacteriophage sp.]
MIDLTTDQKATEKKLKVYVEFSDKEAALVRTGAELDNRNYRSFIVNAALKAAKIAVAASTFNQHFIVYRAIQSGANTAEDVRLMTGLDKPTIALCLNELETLNSLRSETGKGNRTTLWFLTERPALIKRRPLVMDDDF